METYANTIWRNAPSSSPAQLSLIDRFLPLWIFAAISGVIPGFLLLGTSWWVVLGFADHPPGEVLRG